MKRKLSLFLAIALLAAIIVPALPAMTVTAADWTDSMTPGITVYVASTGSDTEGDGSQENPVRSLNKAYALCYATNSSWTSVQHTINVVDDLGTGGLTAGMLSGNSSTWSYRVSTKIVGLSENAGFTACTTTYRALTLCGHTEFDNLTINFANANNDYEYYVLCYYSLKVNENVKTTGAAATVTFSNYTHAAANIAINGGTWDRVFLASTANVPVSATIGGKATVNNLYTVGNVARSTQALTVTNPVNVTVAGGTVENLYTGGRTRQQTNAWTHTSVISTVNATIAGGTVNNLYLGGNLEGAGSGKITIANLNVTQTGGVINNIYTGKNYEGNTNENSVATLNATFTGTPAINFTVATMPTTAASLNFGKTTVNFDADDLAAIKASGATETTLTLGKAAATTAGYEEAYSVAMSGITATADVTLTLGAHIKTATVLNNGTTKDMDANKQVAFTDATLGLFEIDILAANAATIGDAEYSSFKDALAAATSGDTINLMADADLTGETIVLMPGVQIYLGEFDLTAKAVIGLDGAAIGGTAIDGKLYVEKNLLKVDSAYNYGDGRKSIPVWNGDHYTFAIIDFQKTATTVDGDTLKYTFAQVAYSEIEELMAASATNCGLDVQVKLTWMVGEQEFSVICDYTDAAITTVCESATAMYNMYLPGFAALGINAETVTITPMVVSCTGAVVAL